MKRAVTFALAFVMLSGCSFKPDDKALATTIEASMRNQIPLLVVGNALGGKLVGLEEIEIEDVSRETWKPNPLGTMFGMKEYDYWKVTARVKGTAQVGTVPPFTGGNRGFHARHVWGVIENEDGSLSVKTTDFLNETPPQQPANPSWWDIGGDAPERRAEPQSTGKMTQAGRVAIKGEVLDNPHGNRSGVVTIKAKEQQVELFYDIAAGFRLKKGDMVTAFYKPEPGDFDGILLSAYTAVDGAPRDDARDNQPMEVRMIDLYDSLVRSTRAELAMRSALRARGEKLPPLDSGRILRSIDSQLAHQVSAHHEEGKVSLRVLATEPGAEVVEIWKPATPSSGESVEIVRAAAF